MPSITPAPAAAAAAAPAAAAGSDKAGMKRDRTTAHFQSIWAARGWNVSHESGSAGGGGAAVAAALVAVAARCAAELVVIISGYGRRPPSPTPARRLGVTNVRLLARRHQAGPG